MDSWIEFSALVATGFAVGAFGTLIGAGGGFVLIPILVLVYGEKPEKLTAISMAVVFANAVSGTIAYARMKRIHLKAGIFFAIATVPGAILGEKVVRFISPDVFRVIMGALLLVLGAILVIRPLATKRREGLLDASNGGKPAFPNQPFSMVKGVGISLAVGFFASLLGIGGGSSTCRRWFRSCIFRSTSRRRRRISCLCSLRLRLFLLTCPTARCRIRWAALCRW